MWLKDPERRPGVARKIEAALVEPGWYAGPGVVAGEPPDKWEMDVVGPYPTEAIARAEAVALYVVWS